MARFIQNMCTRLQHEAHDSQTIVAIIVYIFVCVVQLLGKYTLAPDINYESVASVSHITVSLLLGMANR